MSEKKKADLTDDGASRRRQSPHRHDPTVRATGAGESASGHEGQPAVRSSARDPEQSRVLTSSQAVPLSPSTPGTRVRFSEDRPRDRSENRPLRSPDSRKGSGSAAHDVAPTQHSPLTITTQNLPSTPSRSHLSPEPISASAAKPSSSPVTPQSRSRASSLRRSVFSRSLHDHGAPSGTVIELESAGPSTIPSTNRAPNGSHHDEKSGHRSVAISPTPDDDLSDLKYAAGYKQSAQRKHGAWPRSRNAREGDCFGFGRITEKLRSIILRINQVPPSKDGRHIDLDVLRRKDLIDDRSGKEYIDNTIRSSRYTLWNFVPRQLFAQFSKLANFYFLCVSILQMIPTLSTTGNYTTIVPLTFFVLLSMAKEGYDDLRRHRLDQAENNSVASVLRLVSSTSRSPPKEKSRATQPISASATHVWAPTKWNGIHVGEIIRLKRDEPVPADVILLHADGPNGIAYIETIALDGETNLKSKQAAPSLAKRCSAVDRLTNCNAHIVVEDPNLDLYNFEGRVTVGGKTEPLTSSEVIYRGSVLRNTGEAIGLVIYTGEECKIRMNATKNPRIKAPSLQSRVNQVVIIIVLFVIALATFNTVAYGFWSKNFERKAWYLINAKVPVFPILASFIILFNTMIPLSLYVSLEIIKLGQMLLMNDIDMYDPVSDTPMEARTSTINEELGQVSYIFSDKTGTLTDNTMRFRKLSVAGTAWLHDVDIQREAQARPSRELLRHKKRKGKGPARSRSAGPRSRSASRGPARSISGFQKSFDLSGNELQPSRWKSSAKPLQNQPELTTEDLMRHIQKNPHTRLAQKARFFLLAIALCHTCLPEVKDDGKITFQAASPDELALVQAAQDLGYMVIDRQVGTITLKIVAPDSEDDPVEEVYEILDVIEFSSQRKRMSIIVRFPNQQVCVVTKGADSTIMKLLKLARLAALKAGEVERKAGQRKSMEAQQVMRRNSTQISLRKDSVPRASTTLSRASVGGLGRRSMADNQIRPIRAEVDAWLTRKEQDDDCRSLEGNSIYYTPRASLHLDSRQSFASALPRIPQLADYEEALSDANLTADDGTVFERCFQHINEFATEGLRTLVYAYRFMDEEEYTSWKKVYLEASTSLVDRQDKIERAGEMIERDLTLAGATAIEDKLQDGVPQAIDKLRRAKIKVWMLTGDKRETAINIGHSCRLIKDYSTVAILDHESGRLEQSIAHAMLDIRRGRVAHSVAVVDGQTLAVIEADDALRSLFFDLMIKVDSVICCRASPSQKAYLVRAIRKRVNKSVTLAIGDGANDIAMIQEAHVGIGITGKEGLQAARTSDYSIAQFRFLLKLLLVHGRWNYIRTCKYTLATFWKEMLFYLTQALFQRWAGYTGTSLYEQWSLTFFNTLFTSLPVIFLGIFEKDLSASTLLAVPELYNVGQRSAAFNIPVYLGWTFVASAEAMVVFFTMVALYAWTTFTRNNDLYAMGALTFTACVTIIATKILVLEMHNKSVVVLIGWVLSVGGWYLFNIILSALYRNNAVYNVKGGLLHRFGEDPLWWLILVLVVMACIVFEVGIMSLRSAWFPTDIDLFQEYEQDLGLRLRFEEAASTELQQGWDREKEKDSRDSAREKEIEDLLSRPRVMEEGRSSANVFRRRQSSAQTFATAAMFMNPTATRADDGDRRTRPRSRVARDVSSKRAGPIQMG